MAKIGKTSNAKKRIRQIQIEIFEQIKTDNANTVK